MKMLKLLAIPVLAAILAPLAATARDLPEGWTRLTFIQGGGAAAATRIKTDYQINPGDELVVAEVEFTDLTANQSVWCARSGVNQGAYNLFCLKTNMRFDYYWCNGSQGQEVPFLSGLQTGVRYVFSATKNTISYSANDGSEGSASGVYWDNGYDLAWSGFTLFASHLSGQDNNLNDFGTFRLYSFKAYRNGVLLHDYVPCKTDDNVVTLYDVVDDFPGVSPSTLTVYGTFKPGDVIFDSDFAATVAPQPFDGEHPCEPHPDITLVGEATVLTEGTDYTLTWSDNDRFGAGIINVTGINDYSGKTGRISFRIVSPYGDGVVYYAKVGGDDAETCEDWAHAGSIRTAMEKAVAADGNAVVLADGTYDLSSFTPSDDGAVFVANHVLTIVSRGGDPEKCILLGGGAENPARFVAAAKDMTLRGITVTNFTAEAAGGAVLAAADKPVVLTVTNCVFGGNSATSGGAICGTGGKTTTRAFDSDFVGNTTRGGGGGAIRGGTVSAEGCAFTGNRATGGSEWDCSGGAIYGDAYGTVRFCAFADNVAYGRGGAIYSAYGFGTSISDCTFVRNKTTTPRWNVSGATISTEGGFTVSRCVFEANAASAGAIVNAAAEAHFHDCKFTVHTERLFHNGDSDAWTIRLHNCRVENNKSNCGSRLWNENCLFAGNGRNDANWATINFLEGGQFFNCTIVGNKSRTNGNQGGIFATGARLVNCIVTADNNVNETAASYTYYATNCIWNAKGKGLLVGEGNNTNLVDDAAIKFAGTGDDPYSIKLNSPARDKGVNVRGYTKADGDVIGNPRLSREGLLDIGCYEYPVSLGLLLLLR